MKEKSIIRSLICEVCEVSQEVLEIDQPSLSIIFRRCSKGVLFIIFLKVLGIIDILLFQVDLLAVFVAVLQIPGRLLATREHAIQRYISEANRDSAVVNEEMFM